MLPDDSVLLDATRPSPEAPPGALLFTAPLATLRADAYEQVPALLAELDRHAAAGRWCAGFLSYEAAYALDPAGFPEPPAGEGPLAWFGVYDEPARLAPDDVDEALLAPAGAYALREHGFALDHDEYARRIARVRHHIREGDVYQINLTAPLRFTLEGEPLALYRDLRRKQRVAYGGVIRTGGRWILSLSPELFVRRDGARLAARPMKGTVRRGADNREDRQRAAWLAADEKNRAENLMIVDLLRNDLSRVAEPGSVTVPDLFSVERYETLWQMTSTVEARAREGVGVAECLRALFPCGSVTGAPKRRAMQLIRTLEDQPRGVYCGAIGMVKPAGDFVFNVPIRTLEIGASGEGRMGIGSGVVWDSEAEAEFEECLLKARFLTNPPPPDFRLLETMRACDGRIALLDRHLARLADAAHYFGFSFDEASVRARLAALGPGERRVRLTLAPAGEIAIEESPLAEDAGGPRRVAVFPEPLPAGDPFVRHKTTHRPFYERALAWARQRGAEEAILVNEQGEVTEGTISNVWIRRGGQLLTPPLAGGGLRGVQRAHLLASRDDAAEAPITPQDLRTADAVLLSNAVRGLWEVQLITPAA
jgi:para-aminobenzoate synthetase / 4-amino-4-deoxychorismate lyase